MLSPWTTTVATDIAARSQAAQSRQSEEVGSLRGLVTKLHDRLHDATMQQHAANERMSAALAADSARLAERVRGGGDDYDVYVDCDGNRHHAPLHNHCSIMCNFSCVDYIVDFRCGNCQHSNCAPSKRSSDAPYPHIQPDSPHPHLTQSPSQARYAYHTLKHHVLRSAF